MTLSYRLCEQLDTLLNFIFTQKHSLWWGVCSSTSSPSVSAITEKVNNGTWSQDG